MKAINNPLRPKIDVDLVFNARNRAAHKTISRRQHRAAERELFRREDLVAAANVLTDRRRTQALHRSAKRDVQRLIAGSMAQAIAQQALDAEQHTLAQQHAAGHLCGAMLGRMLVQQQVTIVRRGAHRDTRTVLAMASCAV